MADTARSLPPRTVAEYLAWEESQADKHEFRKGRVRMMTGGTQRHNLIAGNIYAALRQKLGKGPCRVYTMNARVALADSQAGYYPDVVVDCGPYDAKGLAASKPTLVFEVLSPSTRDTDFAEKAPDYRATGSITQVVFVESDEIRLHVWTLANDQWRESTPGPEQGVLHLPSLGLDLSLADIYEDAFG